MKRKIELAVEEKAVLEALTREPKTPQQLARVVDLTLAVRTASREVRVMLEALRRKGFAQTGEHGEESWWWSITKVGQDYLESSA
jgi:hypothetical protein